jgi:uncharacterized protein (TIGR02996 family)
MTYSAAVVALARTMRASGDFSALPMLADALEESGVEDEAWLRHCREPKWYLECRECRSTGSHYSPEPDCLPSCYQSVTGLGETFHDSKCKHFGKDCPVCSKPRTSSWVVSTILAAVGDPGEHPLRAVCEEPGSDAARLAYADWIEPRDAERAELIRVQCELASLPPEPKMTCSGVRFWTHHAAQVHSRQCNWCQWTEIRDAKILPLRRRERELRLAYGPKWLPWSTNYDRDYWNDRIEFRRGFPAEITCTWADWQQHHAEWWWSPLQTVKCGCAMPGKLFSSFTRADCSRCRGSGRVLRPFPTGERECPTCGDGRLMTPEQWLRSPIDPCDTCRGTGRVPGEPSVMPLECVRLTTLPEGSQWVSDEFVQHYCQQTWPGLRFQMIGVDLATGATR